jgi:cell division protein ZapA
MAGLSSTPKTSSREMQAPEGSGVQSSVQQAGRLERSGGVAKAVASKWNLKSDLKTENTVADRTHASAGGSVDRNGKVDGKKSGSRAAPGTEVARPTGQGSQQVSIAGVPLRLKSSHDEETVNELVRMVDEKIRQALPLTKTGSIQNASILAALNMAEELLLLKRHARELVDRLEARTLRVIEDLEKSGPTA